MCSLFHFNPLLRIISLSFPLLSFVHSPLSLLLFVFHPPPPPRFIYPPSLIYSVFLSTVRLSSQHSYPFCLISSRSPLMLSSIFPICQISYITHCLSSAFLVFFPDCAQMSPLKPNTGLFLLSNSVEMINSNASFTLWTAYPISGVATQHVSFILLPVFFL